MKINYKGYEISTEGFERFDNKMGTIAKVIAKNNNKCNGFIFAISGMLQIAENKKGMNYLNDCIKVVKSKISKKIEPGKIYTFEYKNGSFEKTVDPKWFKNN